MSEKEKNMNELMAEYRATVEEIKNLESRKDALRETIEPLVLATDGKKWSDETGWARMKRRAESVSYSGKEVDNLVSAWVDSDDAIMQSCGRMLQGLRKIRSASEYLEIR